jgi:hypothetical protein
MIAAGELGDQRMMTLSAWLSIGIGVLLGGAQLYRNWGNWDQWMGWGVDIFAALVMVVAGLLALRKRTTRLLPVGWAFGIGLYVSALVSHLMVMLRAEPGALYDAKRQLVVIIVGLLALMLTGLALVLFDRKKAP